MGIRVFRATYRNNQSDHGWPLGNKKKAEIFGAKHKPPTVDYRVLTNGSFFVFAPRMNKYY